MIAITFVVASISTLLITALFSVYITSLYYKHRYELKRKVKVDDGEKVNTNLKQKCSYGEKIAKDTNPVYATPIIKGDNPTYGTATIKMDVNPAYASTDL